MISVEGATLRVVHTPGHTEDHVALLLEEEGSLFSGDCVLGDTSAKFEDLHTYMKSLNTILDLAPTRLYPGHGNVVEDPITRIREYIDHRMTRERHIVASLRSFGQAASVKDIVKDVYEVGRLVRGTESSAFPPLFVVKPDPKPV